MPLNPFLQEVYDAAKEPPEQAPTDWLLIEAAEVAKEQLEVIRKDMAMKFAQLVQMPLDIRTELDRKIVEMEAEVARLQEAIADAKAQYINVEQQWISGQESYEAIKVFYQPQVRSLETQANYLPLSQRATVSRWKKKPKQQQTDDN